MKVAISYADDVYKQAQQWNTRSAYSRGKFDKVIAYSKEDLEPEFLKENERFFQYKRGGGYWIWKSHLIQKTLETLEEGDYLFYCDSGTIYLRSIDYLIRVMDSNHEDIMTFENYDNLERTWTKRDIFVALDHDTEECANTNQIMGGYVLLKKTPHSVKFIDEYVKYCQTGTLITDLPNEGTKENYKEFRENRHDQSVFSILAKKWGVIPYRDPSQWGWHQKIPYKHKCMKADRDYFTYERSKYPMIFWDHRYKIVNPRNMAAAVYHTWKKHYQIMKDPTAHI